MVTILILVPQKTTQKLTNMFLQKRFNATPNFEIVKFETGFEQTLSH